MVKILHIKEVINLTEEEIQDCKEVFMLFDRDVDGILTLPECSTALHTLGRRISGIFSSQKSLKSKPSPSLIPMTQNVEAEDPGLFASTQHSTVKHE